MTATNIRNIEIYNNPDGTHVGYAYIGNHRVTLDPTACAIILARIKPDISMAITKQISDLSISEKG